MSQQVKIKKEICGYDDLKENEMRLFKFDHNDKEYSVLVAKYQSKVYAVGSKCTHYSLPLDKGVFYNGRVRCFAHGACFNIKTGDIEDFPGVDCLPTYTVTHDPASNKVFLEATERELEAKVRIKSTKESLQLTGVKTSCCTKVTAKKTSNNIVVIGAGAAALECVETLRVEGYSNEIVMITSEAHTPYDRPKLSKMLNTPIDKLVLRSEDFYKKNDINFVPNTTVERVNFAQKKVVCSGGAEFEYSRLVIATGLQSAKIPKTSGDDLQGIFTLRSYEDAVNITKHFDSLATKNFVLLGNSFIALETASFFTGKAASITVLCRNEPFKLQLGEKVAQVVKALHESKGVKFLIDPNMSVVEFKAYEEPQFNRKLASLRLNDGTDLPADIFIAAIGSRPVTDFLKGSGLALNAQGYVVVDKFMKTNVDGVYAIGDITSFPSTCIDHHLPADELISIAHWQMASAQGRCAAKSIVDAHEEFRSVPFFWSVNHGKSVRFAGTNRNYDEILFFSDPAGENATKFIAYYVLQGRVVAVCSCDWDPVCAQFAELQFARVPVRKIQIKDDPTSIRNLLVK